jgi:hypothetical protein
MMTPSSAPAHRVAVDDEITSSLNDGKQRFLSQVVAHALASGLRSPRDFVRHFPARTIMLALESQPRLRANIIVPTIGMHEKVALKKSAESAGEDLQIALDERVVDEESVVRLFHPDDRVRYLDKKQLWAFVVEGDFWRAAEGQANDRSVAKRNVAYVVDCARANGLITDHDVVEGLTLDRILGALPKSELVKLVRSAVGCGRHGQQFDDEALLAAMPLAALLEHIPLAQMWDSVVLARIAVPHGFVVRGSAVPPAFPNGHDEDEVVVEIVEHEAGGAKPAAKAHRSRRIGASELSEVKGELSDGHPVKGQN